MFLKKFFLKNRILCITLLLTIPAFIALLRPGYWNMHDDMQMIRQLEFEKCLYDGQIPCRWTPDMAWGYGYPLFHFYPPLPYIVGQVFRTLGVSFMWTVKLTAVSQFILAGLAMYFLASYIFGPLGGLIASVFYTYAPYHAVNVYIRGAMNEAWAGVFFPLLFLFSYKLIESNKKKIQNILGLGLSFGGLALSHNPMALTFVPILATWILFWIWQKNKFKNIELYINFIYSALISIGLVAFYTLPVIFESKLVQIDSMFVGYYSFQVHFTTIKQLFFSAFWGDGASVWGTEDNMSFMVGFAHWILPLLMCLYITIISFKNKLFDKKYYPIFLLVFMGFFTAFLTHERSGILWVILKPIQKIQFPWRFLSHTIFLLSLPLAYIPKLVPKKYSVQIISGLILLVLALNLQYFKPTKSGPLSDAQKFSGKAWENQITSGIYDYLPNASPKAPISKANFPVDLIDPPAAKYEITGVKHGTDWFIFNIKSNVPAKITLAQLTFPNFEILNNNQKISYEIDKEIGRMVIKINQGDNQIYVKLRNTPIRYFSNFLSLFSWIGLLIFLTRNLWMKLISKKLN